MQATGKNDFSAIRCGNILWQRVRHCECHRAYSRRHSLCLCRRVADLIYDASSPGPGIVIAGVGNGNDHTSLKLPRELQRRALWWSGAVALSPEQFGTNVEVNDDEMNLVASDKLNPQKSRILLMLALLKPRATDGDSELVYAY